MTTVSYRSVTGTTAENYQRHFVPAIAEPVSAAPDAESMQHHLQELGEKVRATAEFTDFESLEIYGEFNDALRRWLPHVTEASRSPIIRLVGAGGFTRLSGARSARA